MQLSKICFEKSIELLKNNATPFGILACSPSERAEKRNYLSIFGRDAGICTLGLVLSQDKQLIKAAKDSLINLGKFQAPNGQIPNYIKPEIGKSDFWYLGCIDATLWWLIAIKHYDRFSDDKAQLAIKLKSKITKATNWLLAQEHQKFYLLMQNEASDWADIMPRSGFVLYSNALWLHVKKLYDIQSADKTAESINYIFSPWQKIPDSYFQENHRALRLTSDTAKRCEQSDYLLSYVNYGDCGEETDVFANILACLFGAVSRKKARLMIRKMIDEKISRPYPLKACLDPIVESSKNWKSYMKTHNQNFPNQYHNGGIWPMIGGFWVMALTEFTDRKTARTELEKLAQLNSLNDWQFNEWFHGKTAEPMGMAGQSWNASMLIAAYHCLNNDLDIFNAL